MRLGTAGCFSRPPSKDGELDHNHLFYFPYGVLGLVAATVPGGRTTAWTTTPRGTPADELVAQCWWMEVSTTGAAQR